MNEKCLIGDVAQLFNISSDTLRYYEKEGILAPKKDVNGYRYYGMDDIIRIIDIMFYRGLDIAIKDIASITTSMDMGSIINIMNENEEIIAEKMKKLQKLQEKLKTAKQRFIAADQELGHYKIVATPDMKYDLVHEQDHENIVEVMQRYKKINANWIDSLLFAIYLDRDTLVEKKSFADSKYGIIVVNSKSSNLALKEQYHGFKSFMAKEYLYTVIRTTYDKKENEYITQALKWLETNGRECIGDLIGRYLATSYEGQSTMDYYEIWIPIDLTSSLSRLNVKK